MTKPSNNAITGQFSSNHPGLDYSGKGDPNVYAAKAGVITISKEFYKTNWLQGKEGDPTPWGLTTEDYGNFIKIQHDDGTSTLYAHLKYGTPLKLGVRVSEGQVIAQIGNTGNSTGPHLHFEERDKNGNRIKPVFQEKGNTVPVKDPLQECLAQHSKLVDEANQRDKELKELEDLVKTKENQITGYKGEVTKKETKISELQTQLDECKNAKPTVTERFTSRKFILAVLALLVPVANQQLGWELSATEILAMLTPLLAFMGVEGFTDHQVRMEATKSSTEA